MLRGCFNQFGAFLMLHTTTATTTTTTTTGLGLMSFSTECMDHIKTGGSGRRWYRSKAYQLLKNPC